jgi:hypothetical protein
MRHSIEHPLLPYICLGMLGVVALVSLVWLWFILARPSRWSELVDKENDFWVGKGVLPSAMADWIRRFEKGPAQKFFVGLVGLISAVGFIGVAVLLMHHPHR